MGKERIIDVASGPSINLFLTQYGELYSSSKIEPGRVSRMLVSEKFTRIAVCDYMMGISEKVHILSFRVLCLFGEALYMDNIVCQLSLEN